MTRVSEPRVSEPKGSSVSESTKTSTIQKEGLVEDKGSNDIKKGKTSYHGSFLASVERNQIRISRSLLICLYLFHVLYPSVLPYTSKFIHLQYRSGTNSNGEALYDIGKDDVYFILNCVITLTFLRSFLMQWCFGPFARYYCHIHSKKAKVRFAEQSWSLVYYMFSFAFGVYLYIRSPYWLDIDHIYLNWPHYQITSSFKKYYLISIGFWIQQVFVLNIEEKRKDHYQMFSHHIITCALIIGSYYYYYTRIGHLILMIMDSVDIFLSGAKMLKYAGFSKACDFMFILFLLSWVILRHGLYNYLFYHAWSKATTLMSNAKCVPGVIQKRCWTPNVINFFLGLLGGLQIITIVWMYLIFKIAYKVVTGTGAEDVRSDDEETDVEDESVTEKVK